MGLQVSRDAATRRFEPLVGGRIPAQLTDTAHVPVLPLLAGSSSSPTRTGTASSSSPS